ncbi:MAG: hypothetical protein ACRDTC_18750 [Pseudonocardiaceae bacterium]
MTNAVSGEASTVGGGMYGPGVTIGVLNSGEEPGLLTDIEVAVRRVWSMDGYRGASPVVVTARYDVPLPDELLHDTNRLSLPHTVRAPAGPADDDLRPRLGPNPVQGSARGSKAGHQVRQQGHGQVTRIVTSECAAAVLQLLHVLTDVTHEADLQVIVGIYPCSRAWSKCPLEVARRIRKATGRDIARLW